MSARSMINRKKEDGTYESIYCHSDGYLEGVGKTLFEHYQTDEKIDKLFKNSDISILEESPEKPEGHSFSTPIEGYTVFYHRDRGDKFEEPEISEEPLMHRTGYIWDDGKWFFLDFEEGRHKTKIVLLEDALKAEDLI